MGLEVPSIASAGGRPTNSDKSSALIEEYAFATNVKARLRETSEKFGH